MARERRLDQRVVEIERRPPTRTVWHTVAGQRGLPPPLPPETRTIGQLVAETVRLYQRRFWPSLALGIPAAAIDIVSANLSRVAALAFVPVAGAVLLTASYIAAALLASDSPVERRPLLIAFAAGVLVFVPFPFLASVFILPGLFWLAFVGLAVPVAVIERRGLAASFRRATELARADFVHALGGLATLAIAVFLTRTVLFFLLRGYGEATTLAASVLADIVIAPLLFLGAALLYFDQTARASLRRERATPPRQRVPS